MNSWKKIILYIILDLSELNGFNLHVSIVWLNNVLHAEQHAVADIII